MAAGSRIDRCSKRCSVEAGFDAAVIDASLADATVDEEIRADHQRVLDLGGFGVPTLVLERHDAPLRAGDRARSDRGLLRAGCGIWLPVGASTPISTSYAGRRRRRTGPTSENSSPPTSAARDWRSVAHPVP